MFYGFCSVFPMAFSPKMISPLIYGAVPGTPSRFRGPLLAVLEAVFLPGARYRLAHTAHHAAGSDQVWKMMEDLFGFFGGEILAVFDDFDAVLWIEILALASRDFHT